MLFVLSLASFIPTVLSGGSGYSSGSPWPHFRGQYNNNSGTSPYIGSSTSTVKWKYKTLNQISWSGSVGSDGSLYMGSYDTYMYSFSSWGSIKWRFQTAGLVACSPAVSSSGDLYFGSLDYSFYSLSQSGTLLWKYATGNSVYSSPAIGSDGTIFFGSMDFNLYSFAPSGTLLWSYNTANFIASSPAIGSLGNVYVGSQNSYLYAFTYWGSLQWRYKTGNYVASSPALDINENIYFGSEDNSFYVLSSLGTLQWKYTTSGMVISSPAIYTDGTVYVGSHDYNLYSLSGSGSLNWKYKVGNKVFSSPVVGADGTVYFGSDDFSVYALTPIGSLKWKYTTGGSVTASPIISNDGTIYTGSLDYSIYAIGVIPSASPTFRPSKPPSYPPTFRPTAPPSLRPTSKPTIEPSSIPSSILPSVKPTEPTLLPSFFPTILPSDRPTSNPSTEPSTLPTSLLPSAKPTIPTMSPSFSPSSSPSVRPTTRPSIEPSSLPSSLLPSVAPTVLISTTFPSYRPSTLPTSPPTLQTRPPSPIPSSVSPTTVPTLYPSTIKSIQPSLSPTHNPTYYPSSAPVTTNSCEPTLNPSSKFSYRPTVSSIKPTLIYPSPNPTSRPSVSLLPLSLFSSFGPSYSPSVVPTKAPLSKLPSKLPSSKPSLAPSSISPMVIPSVVPSQLVLLSLDPLKIFPTSPSTLPTSIPSSSTFLANNASQSTTNSSKNTIIIVAVVISAIVLITVIYLLLLRFRLNPLGQNASVKSSDGVIVDAFGISDSYAINSAPLDGINLLSLEGALQVQWSELAAANLSGKGCLLGEGAYGFVVKAIWKPKLKTGKKMNGNLAKEVAIKVLKLSPQDSKGPPFEYACQLMKREANVMKSAERLLFSDCVTKVYGVVQGPLPEAIARIFDLRGGINCVGMVMRYEPGGDLSQYIHCPGKVFRELTLIQKLHILVGISNGISELHGIGIVHGDIKPENILLSSELNPEIRLSDFGLSIIRDEAAITNSQVFQSSLQNTKSEKARGTPLYSAPELLFNPLVPTSTIAKASRKADIYSFAIVVWEVMSQKLPFSGIKSVEQLSWSVQQNVRPLLDDLPHYTPAPISSMISSCWNKNRSLRWIATQCYSTISLQYQQLLFTSFDIYISHSFSKQFTPFLSVLFSELTKCGYRVWFDQNHVEIEDDVETSRIINNCKIFLACVESGYQRHNVCMKNLETITNSMSSPTSTRLVTLVLEADPFTWASNELRSLCAFKTSLFADISSSASVDWALESETTPAALQSMRTQLSPLLKLLSENGCPPTYKVRTGKGYDSNAYSRDTLPVSDVDIQKELSKFP